MQGLGKTFPGTATPFGLVQLSPDTRTGGDNGPGYSYNHTTIEGFSFTHMSGIGWYGDLGNFLVMPTTGKMHTNKGEDDKPEDGYRSRYSHDNETIEAGYYSVLLTDYNIKAELTAATRAGILRFTFPENDSSRIQIDLARRIGGTSTEQYIKLENENTISGWMKCPPEGGGWGNGEGKADYTVYFYCQFSKPFKDYGVWSANIPESWIRKREEVNGKPYQDIIAKATIHKGIKEFQGKHLGFFTNFKTQKDEQILVKSGISFVSIDGARLNLQTDIPHWDFEKVEKNNKSLWNKAISSVTVEGATEKDREIFYTALFHTMIDPRAFSDNDGKYIGADKKIHKTDNFVYRTIFSGWDVFRSQFPLQTIINPAMVNDEINSLIQMADLSGKKYYPRWEFLNSYSGCMIGNPAVSVIVDAYEKGIRNFDVVKAFQYCKNSVDTFGNNPLGYTPNSISQTLEYAYTDWCVGRFAESLNKPSIANEYYQRSLNYKNIWNKEVNWFRAKDEEGNWNEWKGKTIQGQGCVESDPYQQGWFVPHDITGLTALMGGKDSIQKQLVHFFEMAPDDFSWNDYYNHANEPVHHVPFIFNEIGLPRQTQKWTRRICEAAYGTDAYGLCGNEDVGQMSAWYVLASIGIHPINPGDNKYQITSPVFNRIELKLDKKYYHGNTFTIIANNNSKKNIYIKSIKLNGKKLDRYWITHNEIVNGGVLELEMEK
ncbi:GH92 family glycosyl hydrolase [Gaetbulibacter aestuarii]